MNPYRPPRASAARHAYRLAYWNGLVWSVGNGLASTTLVVYLALERGAAGMAVSWILAAPQFVGLLRLATPWLLARTGDRRWFCLANYTASSLALITLAVLAAPGVCPTGETALAAIVVLWALFHLFQYLGTVALWSWLGDLAPARVWGRFVARREQWMLAGAIPAMLTSGLFAAWFRETFAKEAHGLAYALPAAIGGFVMLAALVPLAQLPPGRPRRSEAKPLTPVVNASTGSWWSPLTSASFLWFLAFTVWFSFCNGLTQSAQNVFQARIVGLSLFVMLALQSSLRVGQWVMSPRIGSWCDHLGARAVLIGSQVIVATGLGCYALATREWPQWIGLAHLLWIAYVGLNVGLPSMVRRLAAPTETARYFAWHLAASGVAYAGGTLLGGWLVQTYSKESISLAGGMTAGFFPAMFVAGWVLRTLGIVWLWPIVERPARNT